MKLVVVSCMLILASAMAYGASIQNEDLEKLMADLEQAINSANNEKRAAFVNKVDSNGNSDELIDDLKTNDKRSNPVEVDDDDDDDDIARVVLTNLRNFESDQMSEPLNDEPAHIEKRKKKINWKKVWKVVKKILKAIL